MFLKSSTGWKNNIVFFFLNLEKKNTKLMNKTDLKLLKIFSNFHNFSTIHTKTKIGLKIFCQNFFYQYLYFLLSKSFKFILLIISFSSKINFSKYTSFFHINFRNK